MPKVDQETCIGCGTCESICPEVFKLDSSGKSQVKKGAPQDLPCIKEAVEACPVQAISE